MSWLKDLTGKAITYLGSSVPNRRNLIIQGTGVEVTDNASADATILEFNNTPNPGPVTSIFGRSGSVSATVGDYSADKIQFNPVSNRLTSTQVQGALEELALEQQQIVEVNANSYNISGTDLGKLIVSQSDDPGMAMALQGTTWPIGGSVDIYQAGDGDIGFVPIGGIQSFLAPKFKSAESQGKGSRIRITRITSQIYSFTGDLKETQPRAVFTLDGASVAGSSQQIDVQAAQGQGGAAVAWQLEADGTLTCLISGNYNFSGSLVIQDSNSSSDRTAGIGLRRNGSTVRDIAVGRRESSSTSVDINLVVYGWLECEAGEVFSFRTNSGSTTSFPGNTASRQFWVTRISD